jgi:hypothetical protein
LAKLSALAGGVDGFVIGSELRGLTTIRSGAADYPAVAKLKALAADVRAVAGAGAKIVYAADWTEYSGHQPTDGSNDVFFHLDPLWSDANIDAVGIDLYAPMADWRDGAGHADAAAGYGGPYDLDYLKHNIEHGEDYEWYYVDPAARAAQTRSAITDGAHGEPWVFRRKDIRNWWRNAHHDRPGGGRNAAPTAWVPESKPIWLTEFGCPAVDKGSNQPNVFYDPKSSESALPHFSSGRRDDLAQRRCLEAIIDYWAPAAGNNPLSAVYGGRMIDPARMFVWAWDARPYPDFPLRANVWRDADNWEKGHWLNGRMGLVPVAAALKELCESAGVTEVDASAAVALTAGYVAAEAASARALIEPLTAAYHLDAFESQGVIRFVPRGRPPALTVTADMLAAGTSEDAARFSLTRAQEGDLSPALRVAYADAWADYRSGMTEVRRAGAGRGRVSQIGLDLVMETSEAQGVAERLLAQAWAGRGTAQFALPPSYLALEPGDVIAWEATSPARNFVVTQTTDAGAREIEAQSVELSVYGPSGGAVRTRTIRNPGRPGAPLVRFLDLPLLTGQEVPHAAHVAAFAEPWPGRVNVMRAVGASFALDTQILSAAVMGETTTALYAGPEGRWDNGNAVWVKLSAGALTARSPADVLAGANICAIQNGDGAWEVLQFANAELTAPLTYKVSCLLRGQAGTEGAMRNPVAAGAPFVLITGALRQTGMTLNDRNVAVTWRAGPAGAALDDPRFVETTLTLQGLGLRPLSPVHIRGRRDSTTQDIVMNWIRRTRIGGDAWDGADVALGEAQESYRVEILNGVSVARTLTAASASVVYTAAQQTADFGSAAFSPLDVRVAQVSDVFGAGAARMERLYV